MLKLVQMKVVSTIQLSHGISYISRMEVKTESSLFIHFFVLFRYFIKDSRSLKDSWFYETRAINTMFWNQAVCHSICGACNSLLSTSINVSNVYDKKHLFAYRQKLFRYAA